VSVLGVCCTRTWRRDSFKSSFQVNSAGSKASLLLLPLGLEHRQTHHKNPLPMARDLAPDWILQETLAIQAQTAQWFKDKQAEHAGQKPLTLTVLGCGTTG
jgi:hypothetical protein